MNNGGIGLIVMKIGVPLGAIYLLGRMLIAMTIMITNYIIDLFTPLGLSIALSIIISLVSYRTLVNIYSVFLTIVMKNRKSIMRFATVIAIILILVSFAIKFMNVEKVEEGFVSYQEKSKEILYELKH